MASVKAFCLMSLVLLVTIVVITLVGMASGIRAQGLPLTWSTWLVAITAALVLGTIMTIVVAWMSGRKPTSPGEPNGQGQPKMTGMKGNWPRRPAPTFDALIAPLPDRVRATLRDLTDSSFVALPTTPAELFDLIKVRSIGNGISEGRGGYPGVGDAPGWPDYVAEERALLSAYDALVATYGGPTPAIASYFESARKSMPADLRIMGEGWYTEIDLIAGHPHYSLPMPVGCGEVTRSFPLRQEDIGMLLGDKRRRATLEVPTRTLIDRYAADGGDFTPLEFSHLVQCVVHDAPDAAVSALVEQADLRDRINDVIARLQHEAGPQA